MNTNETFERTSLTNKRMKDLFVAQFAKPADLEKINLSQLTPFHRALLVTDGTVTRFIEAYTLSPVEIVLLHQEGQTLPTEHIWLELPAGAQVVARQVILQTQQNGSENPTIHTYATSLIVPHRLPKVIREGLEIEGEGLGRLLRGSGLETRRDLLWCGLERPNDLPGAIGHLKGHLFLSRAYRVVADGQPIMLINEKFPLGQSTSMR
jgi:chorismate-pyruvate lyase